MRLAQIITMITAMLFAGGCGTNAPDDNILDGGDEMMKKKEIGSFQFSHSGSSTDQIYDYKFYQDEAGTHLTAELNCGWEKLEVDVDAEIMDQLEEIVFTHRMEDWNGFDKTDSLIMDGESFSLCICFMDGTMVTAHGSNDYPKGYGDAESAFNEIFWKLTEIHADKIMEVDPYDYSDE